MKAKFIYYLLNTDEICGGDLIMFTLEVRLFCPYVCTNELASECFPVYCEINGMLEHAR